MTQCSEPGCPHIARQNNPPLCDMHLKRLRRHGDASITHGPGDSLRLDTWDKAHPLVKELIAIIVERGLPLSAVYKRAGVGEATARNWRHGTSPGIVVLSSMYEALGYELRPVRIRG